MVVTFNRRELLRECLGALLAQSQSLERILVVDNVSTDGTREMLAADFAPAQFPSVELLLLPRNVGGAGGFHAGLEYAFDQGFDWLWLLDDDTIAQPDALEQLLAARARFPADWRPDLLASRVLWTDGTMHPMNVPRVKRDDHLESLCFATAHATLSLRSTSFVSCLLHRRHVETYGLPIADYFIWVDDVEYTARILRREFGVLVPASVVLHKTGYKHTEPGPRYYYGLRNGLWMLRHSAAWSGEEKARIALATLKDIFDYLRRPRLTWAKLGVVARALRDGFLSAPLR